MLRLLAGGAVALLVGCRQTGSGGPDAFPPAGSPAGASRPSWRDVQPVDFSARFAGLSVASEPNGDLGKIVWPAFVERAGGDVKELYEFQIVNGDLMKYMPCFCGCGRTPAHKSNRDCYVREVKPDGSVVFDDMAPT